jgi:hypothetical protein
MKKIFYVLMLLPLLGFAQGQVDCSLLSVTDVIIQNDSITFEIFNADTMDTHYPYISYTLDSNGDTIQKGQMSWYVTQAGTSSFYYYTNVSISYVMDSLTEFNVNYPLTIYFTYSNLTGENPGGYTCELIYNTQMDIVNSNIKKKKTLIKTIDILGREVNKVKHKIFIEIYEDGSSKKHVIFE